MSNVVVMEEHVPIRPLHVLVPLIQRDVEEGNHAAETASMPYYRAAGEKLLEAREQLKKRGEWGKWLKRNFHFSQQSANLYISYAESVAKATTESRQSFSSLMEFQRHRSPDSRSYQKDGLPVRPQPWHMPIKDLLDNVNLDRLRQESLKRDEERALQKRLAMQLIDIGYKALASKLHPDHKGGSKEAMSRLNSVRSILKGAFGE